MNIQCRTRLLTIVQSIMYGQSSVNKCYCSSIVPYEYFVQNFPAKKSKPTKEIMKSNRKGGLDSFAENLAERYAYRWESKAYGIVEQRTPDLAVVRRVLNFEEIEWNESNVNDYLLSALHSSQFVEIRLFLVACCDQKVLPARKLMIVVALKCALKGEVECIKSIQNLCKSLDVKEYENQGQYVVYLAGALWVKGNIEDAEKLFLTFYGNNQRLHGKIKYLMKILITEAVSKRGEAALVLSVRFAKKIHEEFQDCTFLIYIWEHCILSDWFCDNQAALELLEDVPSLVEAVTPLIPDITAAALGNSKFDAAQRLCEVLLKYEKKEQFCLALRTLFDYSCMQGDERACLAIIESSRELEVPLTEAQYETFLLLFCNEDKKKKISRSSWKWREKLPEFNLKF